jgi:TraM recognition site of TraD and TraG
VSTKRPRRRPAVWTPFRHRFSDQRSVDLDETIALYTSVVAAFRASPWAATDTIAHLIDRIVTEIGIEVPHDEGVCIALDRCLRELLQSETKIFCEPQVDLSRPLSLSQAVALRKMLREQADFLGDQDYVIAVLQNVLSMAMATVIESLPPLSDSLFVIPLIALARDPARMVDTLISHICDPEAVEAGLLTSLRDRVVENVCRYSGIPPDGSSTKQPIFARDADLPPEELVHTYFTGTPFHDLLLTSAPFSLPEEQRYAGHWIVAPSGRGKTTLLHTLFVHDCGRDASIIIMDSKGDLIGPIKELAAIKDRLVLIEPDPEHPLALNPLDIPRTNIAHSVNLLEYIFSALLDAKMTALQMTLFRKVLPAIVEVIPNATLETFADVIANGFGKYETNIALLPAEQREFFFDAHSGFLSKTYTETRNQLIWRLQFLLSNPVIRQMFSAMKTKLDIGREMDRGRIILIDNSKKRLGDEGAEFFGRFFIALVLAAAEQRSGRAQSEKKSCFFYIDECQTIIRRDEKISTILDECRSQKIAMILAHQRTAQITNDNVLDALSNCAIRMANSDDEAKYLADKLRSETETLRSLPRGTFATFVRDHTRRAIALKVPYIDLTRLPRLSSAEQREIRERMRLQYSFTPAERSQEKLSSTEPQANAAPREQSPGAVGKDRMRRQTTDEPETGATW